MAGVTDRVNRGDEKRREDGPRTHQAPCGTGLGIDVFNQMAREAVHAKGDGIQFLCSVCSSSGVRVRSREMKHQETMAVLQAKGARWPRGRKRDKAPASAIPCRQPGPAASSGEN